MRAGLAHPLGTGSPDVQGHTGRRGGRGLEGHLASAGTGHKPRAVTFGPAPGTLGHRHQRTPPPCKLHPKQDLLHHWQVPPLRGGEGKRFLRFHQTWSTCRPPTGTSRWAGSSSWPAWPPGTQTRPLPEPLGRSRAPLPPSSPPPSAEAANSEGAGGGAFLGEQWAAPSPVGGEGRVEGRRAESRGEPPHVGSTSCSCFLRAASSFFLLFSSSTWRHRAPVTGLPRPSGCPALLCANTTPAGGSEGQPGVSWPGSLMVTRGSPGVGTLSCAQFWHRLLPPGASKPSRGPGLAPPLATGAWVLGGSYNGDTLYPGDQGDPLPAGARCG